MTNDNSRRSFPWQVILMFAIIVGTMLAGYLMVPTTDEQRQKLVAELGTTNEGVLMQPVVQINDLRLVDSNGQTWRHEDQRRKWRLLVVATGDCSQACRDRLYQTRQVHIRLAKHATRVERVFVDLGGGPDDGSFKTFLATEHPHVQHLFADPADLALWLEDTNLVLSEGEVPAIVVDPVGGAMMFYNEGHEGTQMLEDLNHLLKFSRE